MSQYFTFKVQSLAEVHAQATRGVMATAVTVQMTAEQRKAAIKELLGTGWGEQEAFEFLRAEFPAWFEGVAA